MRAIDEEVDGEAAEVGAALRLQCAVAAADERDDIGYTDLDRVAAEHTEKKRKRLPKQKGQHE